MCDGGIDGRELKSGGDFGGCASPRWAACFPGVAGSVRGSVKAVSAHDGADLNSVAGDPEGIRGRRKHKKGKVDPRLKRWGITVVPVVSVGGSTQTRDSPLRVVGLKYNGSNGT